jgi:hypothetical protein
MIALPFEQLAAISDLRVRRVLDLDPLPAAAAARSDNAM